MSIEKIPRNEIFYRNNSSTFLSTQLEKMGRLIMKELSQTTFGRTLEEKSFSRHIAVMILADLQWICKDLQINLADVSKGKPFDSVINKMHCYHSNLEVAERVSYDYKRRLWVLGHRAPHRLIAHLWVCCKIENQLFSSPLIPFNEILDQTDFCNDEEKQILEEVQEAIKMLYAHFSLLSFGKYVSAYAARKINSWLPANLQL